MAKTVKKIPFPDWLLKTDCVVKLYEDKISEDGDKIIHQGGITTKCMFSEASNRRIDKDGKVTSLSGKVIIKGDIAPKLKVLSGGTVIINEREMQINRALRLRNPDGTVHHTELELT